MLRLINALLSLGVQWTHLLNGLCAQMVCETTNTKTCPDHINVFILTHIHSTPVYSNTSYIGMYYIYNLVRTMSNKDDQSVKRMAELLRQGATMLADSCPQCGSPLFKVKDDVYCVKCDRRIVYAKGDETVEAQAVKSLLPELRETLLSKLKALNELVESETDVEVLTRLANLMVLLLQSLHSLEKMKG